ncbi:MAG: hydantoinase B/oxoprolinase family protein, partial [Rhodospirillaceae bacterium]|nr:hydantoinase B/oxoprolinase family protein [Rhodospirillaceae bacterium]
MNVQQRVAADRVDITTLATMQGALTSITDEMSQVVIRTARSPVFKLAKDFSCTLCDWQSRQMIQGDAELPVHVGSIPFVCRAVAEAYQGNIAPGDTFLCNDPAFGGLHLNDVALLRPIFVDDELLFWAVIRAHWLDIGGPSPADLRRAQSDSYGEGI